MDILTVTCDWQADYKTELWQKTEQILNKWQQSGPYESDSILKHTRWWKMTKTFKRKNQGHEIRLTEKKTVR